MCGRYALYTDMRDLVDEFDLRLDEGELAWLMKRYNIAPTQTVAAILKEPDNGRVIVPMRWGLVPSWAKDVKIGASMINARGETLAEKPAFRIAFKRRRCIIPASGFYEWRKTDGSKTPMFTKLKSESPMAFAALWETWKSPEGQDIQSCSIVTTEPNELMATIHDRMPVILPKDVQEIWLDPQVQETAAVVSLIQSYPSEEMAAHEVSTFVNKAGNEDPRCIEKVARLLP